MSSDFLQNTMNISGGSFDGMSSSLSPATRRSFPSNNDASKSFLTMNDMPLVVEHLSMSFADVTGQSYGNNELHLYKFTELNFSPQGVAWNGIVEFKRRETDSQNREQFVTGRFGIKAYCRLFDIEGRFNTDRDIYSVDLELSIPRGASSAQKVAIKKTFDEVSYDTKRTLLMLDLPEFPEGCKGKRFRSIYQLNSKLKTGSFGTVCLGTHRASGTRVAIKCVLRKQIQPNDDATIYGEVEVLASLSHDFICPLIDFFVEDDCYYIVMEYMAGGDLFDRLGKLQSYNEQVARDVVSKLLIAIQYCHENNIAHCDLKPKNLLLQEQGNDSSIKLADFGFASRVYFPNSLTKRCGTPYFVAPEILKGTPYDQKSDMWSVGIIIFCLLSGQLPFVGTRPLELYRSIISGVFNFEDECWGSVSQEAKNLIEGLLVTDPDKRLTASQALRMPWFHEDRRRGLRSRGLMQASGRLKIFNAKMKFKSAILATQSVFRMKNMVREKAISDMLPDVPMDENYSRV